MSGHLPGGNRFHSSSPDKFTNKDTNNKGRNNSNHLGEMLPKYLPFNNNKNYETCKKITNCGQYSRKRAVTIYTSSLYVSRYWIQQTKPSKIITSMLKELKKNVKNQNMQLMNTKVANLNKEYN